MERKRDLALPGEILEEIEKRAAAYTPEWHMDLENPDIGTALAQVYGRLQNSTERKYRGLPEKFRIDFFNCLNTSMKASVPARGYAVFGLADSAAEGTGLPAGTALKTDAEDEYGEKIPVETEEDLFVIPDTLETVFESSDGDDYIGLYYDRAMAEAQEGAGGTRGGFPLFKGKAPDLQEHVFYLGHPCILSVTTRGKIHLDFYERKGIPIDREILRALADPAKAEFFYFSGSREVLFSPALLEETGLVLTKTADMPPWEETENAGVTSYWLGCRIHDKKPFEGLAFEELFLWTECPPMAPDLICAAGEESRGGACFAFGEQPSVYGDVYFLSGEVLGKKGALVELAFEQEFARVPAASLTEGPPVRWKLVMPKDEVRPEKEYEIAIEEVIWEYYNGRGWTSLFPDSSYSRIFHSSDGRYRKLKRVEFVCPEDMEKALVGAAENFAVRARILKVSNAFKTSGYYMAPVISGVSLRYRYEPETRRPGSFYEKNNLEERYFEADHCLGAMKAHQPVFGTGDREPALYLGFRERMEQGPVRILWVMEHDLEKKPPELVWEYFRDGRWRDLHPADGTESLRKTGILTFPGMADASLLKLFGRELYWIRARDEKGTYKKGGFGVPEIRQIWLNAVRVRTVRQGITERLTMEGYMSGESFQLLNRNIHEAAVWALESRVLGEEESESLLKAGRLRELRDADGTVKETWIRWEETENFLFHGPADRVYMLDANEGVLAFGGGIHGAIPAPGIPDGILVEYSTGGGSCCCLRPGQIDGLELSAGFVNEAFNPLPLFGGCDRETAGEAMERAGKELKHRFRAVTGADYVDLAMEAVGNIEKADCFSGMDLSGSRQPGAVTLVILRKNREAGDAAFADMRQEIREYLAKRLPAGMSPDSLFIREPLMVEIQLLVTAEVDDFSDLFPVRRAVERTLEEFLDPVTGNFDQKGWQIGTLPDRLQMETVIKKVPGLRNLKSLVVFGRIPGEPGRPEVDLEAVRRHPYVLPVGGRHQIWIQTAGQ